MFYLGIDLGGTNIKAGIVDHWGNLITSDQIATESTCGLEQVICNITAVSNNLIHEAEKRKLKIKAVGIGVPGPVEDGVIIRCVNLGWIEVPITQILQEALALPVSAGNDANMAAMAELEAGALAGAQVGIALTIGTGIGAGIVVNGRLQTGYHRIGGELGHMIVGENFYSCHCGRNGCVETFSSAPAMISYTKKLIMEGADSRLRHLFFDQGEEINTAEIMKAAKEGDAVALKAVDRAALYLGKCIMNVVAVLDPEKIVIGGGVSQAGEWFLDKIRTAANHERYFREIPLPEITFAKFGNEAGIIGAAILAKNNFTKDTKEKERKR